MLKPLPSDSVDEDLSHEDRWQLGEGEDGKVDELVPGQVFHVELAADVEEVIQGPEINILGVHGG